MDVAPQANFDTLLQTAKATAPGTFKSADIRRLLGVAGKRPTDAQLAQIGELISTSPNNAALVYELLGELEIAPKPNLKVALLKPVLSRIAESWFSNLPPSDQDASGMLSWLRMQFEPPPDGTPIHGTRLRGVSLFLLRLYRTPNLFLKCLQEVGPLMEAGARPSGKASPQRQGTRGGFIMEDLARVIFVAGKGDHPKFFKISELSSTVKTVLTYLSDREAAAESALNRQQQVQGALNEQRRVNGEQAEVISKLEQETAEERAKVDRLSAESARWKQLHEQAVNHTNSAVEEGRKTLWTDLQSKILPKVGDARLYANRPNPAVDHVLRLLGEIDEILRIKEGQK